MVLPNTRYRAQKKWSAMAPEFVEATTDLASSSTTTFGITVPAGQVGTTVIFYAAGNSTTYARIDDVDMTLLGTQGSSAMYAMQGVTEGGHTVRVGRSGTSNFAMVALIYKGVTAISASTGESGSGRYPTSTPAGGGALAIAGFSFSASSSEVSSITANGELRATRYRTSGNVLGFADRPTAPVEITLASSSSWSSLGAWLT